MLVFEEEGDDCDASLGSSVGSSGAVYEEEPTHLKKGVVMKGLSKVMRTTTNVLNIVVARIIVVSIY